MSRLAGKVALITGTSDASIAVVGPWDNLTIDDWHHGLRNELDLVFYACKAAWPHLVTRGGGSIINIASIASIRGAAFFQQAIPVDGGQSVIE